jgi:transposase
VPIVLQEDGFRVRLLLPPREHGPPHVYVDRAGGRVVILLPSDNAPCEIRTVYRMRDADVVAAVRLVERNAALRVAAWRHYHGDTPTE